MTKHHSLVQSCRSKKCFLAPALLSFVCFLGLSSANAQVPLPGCFTVASLQGSYTVVGNYGANVAIALGRRYFDGNGNMTGTCVINEPTAGSTTGARTIITGTQLGTYTVNCDGTGVIIRTVTASNGVVANQTDDFVITGAIGGGFGQFLATALADASRVPSAIVLGGIFLSRTYTRLPDRPGPTLP